MHFTIVFDAHEGYDLTACLAFKPTPVWVSGGEDLIVLRSAHAGYERGDARSLLDHPAMQREFPADSNNVVVVVHESGYGTQCRRPPTHAIRSPSGPGQLSQGTHHRPATQS